MSENYDIVAEMWHRSFKKLWTLILIELWELMFMQTAGTSVTNGQCNEYWSLSNGLALVIPLNNNIVHRFWLGNHPYKWVRRMWFPSPLDQNNHRFYATHLPYHTLHLPGLWCYLIFYCTRWLKLDSVLYILNIRSFNFVKNNIRYHSFFYHLSVTALHCENCRQGSS